LNQEEYGASGLGYEIISKLGLFPTNSRIIRYP